MAAADESRVLRFFGVEEAAVCRAAGRCGLTRVESRACGAETLLALTAPRRTLRRAEGRLRRAFPAGLYGAGGDTLADCTARALVKADRLLACADDAALQLLAPRLAGRAGIDRVFDFGAGSCADPDAAAKMDAAVRRGAPAGPLAEELCRLQAALRVTRADLAAGARPLAGGTLVAVACRKGGWSYLAAPDENAALRLLDMIRRAAAGRPQAAGVRFTPRGRPPQEPSLPAPSEMAPAPAPKPDTPPARRSRWPARLAFLLGLGVLAGLAAAWQLTGGDLSALPDAASDALAGLLRGFSAAPQPPAHSGAVLM